MTWIALADAAGQQFSRNGLDGAIDDGPAVETGPHALMVRGSLMLEARLSPGGRCQNIINYRSADGWLSELTVEAMPGGITLCLVQNDDVIHSRVTLSESGRPEIVRITYSWDAPGRWARLAIERSEGCAANIVNIENPHPMLVSDLRSLFLDQAKRSVSEDFVYAALSNQVEPVGPMPKLEAHTPIETSNGLLRAGDLQRGDLIRSADGELVPVLGVVHRSVPARGSLAPVRMCAPYFGLKQDILIAPDQRLVFCGAEVQHLFGKDAVLVPARHLVNGTAAKHQQGLTTITYSQVFLPGNEALMAAGMATESLYIGRLRRKTAQLSASLLSGMDRNNLPEHGYNTYPVLQWFDAVTLAAYRAA